MGEASGSWTKRGSESIACFAENPIEVGKFRPAGDVVGDSIHQLEGMGDDKGGEEGSGVQGE